MEEPLPLFADLALAFQSHGFDERVGGIFPFGSGCSDRDCQPALDSEQQIVVPVITGQMALLGGKLNLFVYGEIDIADAFGARPCNQITRVEARNGICLILPISSRPSWRSPSR